MDGLERPWPTQISVTTPGGAPEERKAARRPTKFSKANPSFPTETYWMIPGSPHTLVLNGGLHFALRSLGHTKLIFVLPSIPPCFFADPENQLFPKINLFYQV